LMLLTVRCVALAIKLKKQNATIVNKGFIK